MSSVDWELDNERLHTVAYADARQNEIRFTAVDDWDSLIVSTVERGKGGRSKHTLIVLTRTQMDSLARYLARCQNAAYCPTHAAAPRMLEALRDVERYCPVAVQDRLRAILRELGE